MVSGLIPQETIDEIATRLDIVEIINDYVLLKTGETYKGFAHQEKHRLYSFPENRCSIVSVVEQVKCVYIYYAKEGLTFPEAVEN